MAVFIMNRQDQTEKRSYWRPLFGITKWDGRHREENAPNFVPGGPILEDDENRINFCKLGTSILAAVFILIAFYFIPFPINLILFFILLILFTAISFLVYMRHKHQSRDT